MERAHAVILFQYRNKRTILGHLMSHRDQSRSEILDNLTDPVIAGRCSPVLWQWH